MIPRWLLAVLVYSLPILAITLVAMFASAALVGQMGDSPGARGLKLVAILAAVALVIDALLLLTVLGIKALDDR